MNGFHKAIHIFYRRFRKTNTINHCLHLWYFVLLIIQASLSQHIHSFVFFLNFKIALKNMFFSYWTVEHKNLINFFNVGACIRQTIMFFANNKKMLCFLHVCCTRSFKGNNAIHETSKKPPNQTTKFKCMATLVTNFGVIVSMK